MNGYDANALEAALQLREQHGGRVTAVCLGDDTSRDTLKRALAMGADAAVLLNDPAWLNLDSAGIGAVLAAAMRKIGAFDLVLCGRQASDTDGGQVLYWLAESARARRGISGVEDRSGRGGSLTVQRLSEDGFQRLRVALPALLGISSEINEPRMPSLKGTMAAGARADLRMEGGGSRAAAREPKVELRRLESGAHARARS